MAKSLQDQLLAAGALKKDRATKLKKDNHKQAKQRLRGAAAPDEIKVSARQAQAEKAERDRALSRELQAAMERKAILAQVRQLIETNRIDNSGAETAHNFSDQGVIRTIYVTEQQHTALIAGHLAIVQLDESYTLVPAPVAAKIMEREPAAIALMNSADQARPAAEDGYAEYQIPDDLTW